MSVDLSQFIPTFLEESFEGLAIMESGLLNLEQGDNETINSIFRAAHSIKGGAGTFGFMQVTEFTHLVETLLDEMRDGRRDINPLEIELLLESVDCMRSMIEAIQNEIDFDDSSTVTVKVKLETLLNDKNQNVITNEESILVDTESRAANRNEDKKVWQINFIPELHLVQTGNDPLLLFNALEDYGELQVIALTENLPAITDMDVEELYIQWQLTLISDTATENDILEVFEWVEDECELTIELKSPPKSSVKDNANQALETTTELDENQPDNHQAIKVTKPQAIKAKTDHGSIRVGVDKVDILINLVGELVITQSMLSELGNDFDSSKIEKLTDGLEQLLLNTRELQESVLHIRMLPISFAFNRFPRLIHDLAKKTGKNVELIIHGENTELDKTVMEQIGDPLVHLVRNAVDHGIESSEVRLANGKSEQGNIWLDAYHQGGNIVIEIRDDGGGINREAVFNKAVEKGLIDPSSNLTDTQVFELIFEPGFSTAEQLSDISGRGVGMDVVKKNIQALGGRIQVESEVGKGSTFKVNLPLTLAILDGQLIRVGSEVYIVPLITIVESLQTKPEFINRVSGDLVLYRLREDNVPVIPLYQLFNLPVGDQDIENALLVVVEADGQKVGLMVDDLLAQQQVVIKSLKDNYQEVAGILGATILGNGSVAMILDVPGIIQMALNMAKSKQKQPNSVSKVVDQIEGALT